MLTHLHIENYTLIQALDLSFTKGLTVITGETGAGKSILLGALSLVLGARMDKQVIYHKDKKCVIEAQFDISKYDVKSFFEYHDLDYDDHLIIRREIVPSGKSRAFINDTPVNLQQMKTLGEMLVDIHSQHKTLTLNQSNTQLTIVDQIAQQKTALKSYQALFHQYKKAKEKLYQLKEAEKQAKLEENYLQFLYDELMESRLEEIEEQDLEEELQLLTHAENISNTMQQSLHTLSEDEQNILDQLQWIQNDIQKQSTYHKDIKTLSDRLESLTIELKDIVGEIENITGNVVYDAERIEILNEKMDLIFRLQQKHQVNSVEELLEKKESLEKKLNNITSLDHDIKTLSSEVEDIYQTLQTKAKELSNNRKEIVPVITSNVLAHLKLLGMPESSFTINIEQKPDITIDGIDDISFLFSANKGSDLQPIQKIASGGELSRFMLSIKSVTAQSVLLPTIIFDEIDSGVSGDIAGKTGNILKKMAKNMQVIAITHLPQIAAKSNDHLFVYKNIIDNQTFSHIKRLSNKEKINEVAKMLSDNKVTSAAIKNAEALING